MSKIIVHDEHELNRIILNHRDSWMNYSVWLLEGPLGVGKTSFVKQLVNTVDPDYSNVRSPSFSLVHTYKTDSATFIHADFYRVENATFEDFGLHEFLQDKNTICLVEWPEKLASIPDIPYLHITFSFGDNGNRILTVKECA